MPDGLTQVILVDGLILSLSAHSVFVSTATSRNLDNVLSKPLFFIVIKGLSIIPVSDTPNNRSSSVFRCHTFRRYGNLVKED